MKNKIFPPIILISVFFTNFFFTQNLKVKKFSIKKANCVLIPFTLDMFKNSLNFNSLKITDENGKPIDFSILILNKRFYDYKKVISALYDRYKTSKIIYIHILGKSEEILFGDEFNLPKKLIQIYFKRKDLKIKKISFLVSKDGENFKEVKNIYFQFRNFRLFLFTRNVRGRFFKLKVEFENNPSYPVYAKIYYPLVYLFINNLKEGTYLIKYGMKELNKNEILKSERIPECKHIILKVDNKNLYIKNLLITLIILGLIIFLKLTYSNIKNILKKKK